MIENDTAKILWSNMNDMEWLKVDQWVNFRQVLWFTGRIQGMKFLRIVFLHRRHDWCKLFLWTSWKVRLRMVSRPNTDKNAKKEWYSKSSKTQFGTNIVIYDTLIYFIYFIYMTNLENGKDHFRSIGSYNLRLALVLPVLVLEAEPKLAAAPNVSSGGVSY